MLLDYRTHQRRLLPPLAATYALHFALHELADRYAAGPDRRRSAARSRPWPPGSRPSPPGTPRRRIQACREACGGQGYLVGNRFAALKADTDVFTTFEGDNTVLLQLVAKGLLSEFRQEVGDMNCGRPRPHGGGPGGPRGGRAQPDPHPPHRPEHLRDPEFHDAALRSREDTWSTPWPGG